MIRILSALMIVFFVLPIQAKAELLSIDLAEDHLDITTGFNGGLIHLFGHRKNDLHDVFVVLEGPKHEVKVRQKTQMLGAWMNTSTKVFEDIPVYYDYAFDETNTAAVSENIFNKFISAENFFDIAGVKNEKKRAIIEKYKDAFIDERKREGLYPVVHSTIKFIDENFFKLSFELPANVPKGQYMVRAFLHDDGKIITEQRTSFWVGQVGFNAKVNKFSEKESLVYALLCVFLALFSGWLSNKIARK